MKLQVSYTIEIPDKDIQALEDELTNTRSHYESAKAFISASIFAKPLYHLCDYGYSKTGYNLNLKKTDFKVEQC
jgi:hypothetical protein